MFIEAAKVNPNRTFYGTDLDKRCAKMCAINMWLFDRDAVVEWGDTLAGKTWVRWVIRKGGLMEEYEPSEEPERPHGPEQGALPWAA